MKTTLLIRSTANISLVFCLLLSGCMTINATVPSPPALEPSPQAATRGVILSPVKDGRGNSNVGGIGSASFDLKSGLSEYIQNSFTNGLTRSGYAVNSIHTRGVSGEAKTVVVTVQSASIASFDALLEPAHGEVSIAVQVFGNSDSPIYARSYQGTYSETVGIHGQSGYEEDAGRIIGTAADRAIDSAIGDANFQAAIRS
jgi:hypothetical protein